MIGTPVWQLLRRRLTRRRVVCPWCGQDHGTPPSPAPLRPYPPA